MSNLDRFSLYTGIIGLLADAITLLGLTALFPITLPEVGLRNNPEIIAIWTFFLMIYGVIICLYYIYHFARMRWERIKKSPNSHLIYNASLALGYLLWLPISITWGIAMIHLFQRTYNLPITNVNGSIFPELGWLYFAIIVPFGGFALTKITIFLNNYFVQSNYPDRGGNTYETHR